MTIVGKEKTGNKRQKDGLALGRQRALDPCGYTAAEMRGIPKAKSENFLRTKSKI